MPPSLPEKFGQLFDARFVRFLCVGVLNAAFGYGVVALLLAFGLSDAMALLGGTILGVLFNFKTTGALVFKSHDNGLILRFIAVYAVVFAVNWLAVKSLERVGVGHYYGFALLLVPMAVLAFLLQRRFVFHAAP